MEEINKIIGKNLSVLRKQAKLTQLELAEKFNYSDKSISKWEAGDSMPSVEVLKNLADFYGVSMDYLMQETHEEIETSISNDKDIKQKTKKEKIKRPKVYSTKLMIVLLSVCAVWLVATTVFVCLQIFAKINYSLCFIWALPASFVVLVVFNSIWGHFRYLFPILTLLLWTLIASIHIQLLTIVNAWQIYLVGIPLQIGIILWACLVKRPKEYIQKQRDERKQRKAQNSTDINNSNENPQV